MADFQELEKLVAAIQKQLAPSSDVQHNVKLDGRRSGVKRQIDVLVSQKVGQYEIRIIIDCKDHKNPVDVKGVEEFGCRAPPKTSAVQVVIGDREFETGVG